MYSWEERQGTLHIEKSDMDGAVPEGFYSTTNYPTYVFWKDQWVLVEKQRMDALIVKEGDRFVCKKLRDIFQGDEILMGDEGICVKTPEERMEDKSFKFMDSNVSSEKRNELLIRDLAHKLVAEGKKLTVVCGPAIVHTGANIYLADLIAKGYVRALLAGNAVAVHDMEKSFFNTSLGVNADTGQLAKDGYRNHMRAINRIKRAGSIQNAVDQGILTSGIMYALTKYHVPYVLAGSLRDDGPLPETKMNMIDAQTAYDHHLRRSDIVVVLSTMLHGIASGNMLPYEIPMYCVDISSNVVTKLSDRGSAQSIGIVTDVGLFLRLLQLEINDQEAKRDQAQKDQDPA
ncbi:MAG: TIGR00300 family protein [Tissierellia bacterium]|nr:TIGR00300 family protein [Tissierellia bacterium]